MRRFVFRWWPDDSGKKIRQTIGGFSINLWRDIKMLQYKIAGGRTKGANKRSFVFVHLHGGDNVT